MTGQKARPALGTDLGWGVAAASWGAFSNDCEAAMEFRVDGRLRVTCGTAEIGTGAYTMFAQVASEATGVPLDRIDVVLGDTSLPKGPVAGGFDADGVAHPDCDRGCAGGATKAGGRRSGDAGPVQGR
jgi:xanthine dehydrogenase YagR molybdenum-binding subunit